MTTPAAWACGGALLVLAACQAAPDVAEREANTTVVEKAVETTTVQEPDPEPVVVAGAGPPLVVVDGRAGPIAACLYGKLAAHEGLAAMGLAPTAPAALDNGAFRLQPAKAILVQTGKNASTTESIGRMTYTTTVAPAGGHRTAVYFEPEAPDLSGTILHSLMQAVHKATRRQARVCAL